MDGTVRAVHRSDGHTFSKRREPTITLVAGLGVEGDTHSGARVRHRSRVRADPTQPNLRQVHLIPVELFTLVALAGYTVAPGDLGENVTTEGLELEALPVGTLLRLGRDALLSVTGLRNPCGQIDGFRRGLLSEVRTVADDGSIERRAGVMTVVVHGGQVTPGDPIAVALPPPPHQPQQRV